METFLIIEFHYFSVENLNASDLISFYSYKCQKRIVLKYLIFFQEETEDMWHVYNLIAEHDSLRASTFRKVVKESNTGTSQAQKIRVNFYIHILLFQMSNKFSFAQKLY